MRSTAVTAIGSVTWDRFLVVKNYPSVGTSVRVERIDEFPGGNTGNSAVTLARLGVTVGLAACVGDDAAGERLRSELRARGVLTDWIETLPNIPTDTCDIIASDNPRNRTIFWRVGARFGPEPDLREEIFSTPVLLIDADQESLLRSVLAHLANRGTPRPLTLGTLQYIREFPTAFDAMIEQDVVTGNQAEWLGLTQTASIEEAIATVQSRMGAAQLRAFFVTLGENGCLVCTADAVTAIAGHTMDVVDTTGAGDAFTGGVAYGLLRQWDWLTVGQFANAVGALSTRALGAQSALPTIEEVYAFLGWDRTAA